RSAHEDQEFLLRSGIHQEAERLCGAASRTTSPEARPLLAVYRPESWAATTSRVHVPELRDSKRASALKELSSGKVFPVQWMGADGIAAAPVSAMGIALFEPVEKTASASVAVRATELSRLR